MIEHRGAKAAKGPVRPQIAPVGDPPAGALQQVSPVAWIKDLVVATWHTYGTVSGSKKQSAGWFSDALMRQSIFGPKGFNPDGLAVLCHTRLAGC